MIYSRSLKFMLTILFLIVKKKIDIRSNFPLTFFSMGLFFIANILVQTMEGTIFNEEN
jgi:hypothetical protein